MSETLKACPFCGGEAELVPGAYRDGGYLENTAYVRCKGCGLRTYEFHECEPAKRVQGYAVDMWNRRNEPTCHLVDVTGQGWWECDECGASIDWDDPCTPPSCNFCPNCGARVVEDRE